MAVLESTSITLNISAYCQNGLRLLRTELHTSSGIPKIEASWSLLKYSTAGDYWYYWSLRFISLPFQITTKSISLPKTLVRVLGP